MRAGIAGAGLMGLWHARAIQRAGGEIAAVMDIDSGAAARLSRLCNAARTCANPAELLRVEGLNVLHVCTPLDTHFELTAEAMTRGIHVLVEKPMTRTATGSERLYELAAEHRVLLCPVHQFPFQRGVRKVFANLGRIGRLLHFEAIFCSAGGAGRSADELDQIVSEILPHPLSLMRLFTPESLCAKEWLVSRTARGELRATIIAGEICSSILISMNSRPTTSVLRLFGTNGTIHVDLFHGFSLTEPGAVSRWRKIIHPFDLSARTFLVAGGNLAARAWQAERAYPGLLELIKSFYRAIASGAPPPITPEEAIQIGTVRDSLGRMGYSSVAQTEAL